MSACISRGGEYSDHELDDQFTCRWCFVFDAHAALARIEELEAALEEQAAECQEHQVKARTERDAARSIIERAEALLDVDYNDPAPGNPWEYEGLGWVGVEELQKILKGEQP